MRVARSEVVLVWGVKPVEVKEAAARPVVCAAVGLELEAGAAGGGSFLGDMPFCGVGGVVGFLGARASAPFPRADLLTLRLGSLRSRC